MLNRTKVLKELSHKTPTIFLDYALERAHALALWQKVVANPVFQKQVQVSQFPWVIPTWAGPIEHTQTVLLGDSGYQALSVDGSQIYPDRHQGINCYVINIGSVALHYNNPSSIFLDSTPYVSFETQEDNNEISPEIVNCRRTELELRTGLELSKKFMNQLPLVFMVDGSLIFWHLESKEPAMKYRFLASYLALLEQFYQEKILIAGYISLPKSKELVNILRAACLLPENSTGLDYCVDHLVDTDVADFFVTPGTRTALFAHRSTITQEYPEHLKPYFFYMHVGTEIARIEIPAYIAHDAQKVATVAQIILDQSIKGRGYPVCLAEAHEQAVVKGADRDFFYHLLQKITLDQKQHYHVSQKSLKKRSIGI